MKVTKTGTVKNHFWACGRAAYVYWDDEDGKIGHSFPAEMIPEADFGEDSRIRVTLEVLEDREAGPNPFACVECGKCTGHHEDCPKHSKKRST